MGRLPLVLTSSSAASTAHMAELDFGAVATYIAASERMILMTHAPSYGILDQIPSGLSVGSPAVKEIVDKYHPILALSGHIHEAMGVVEQNGTTFVNPGPAKDGRFGVIEIVDGKVKAEIFRH